MINTTITTTTTMILLLVCLRLLRRRLLTILFAYDRANSDWITHIHNTMISPGLVPIGVLDLQPQVFGCSIVPPPTPSQRASGPRMCTPNVCHGALGGPLCDHFFASILKSILDSFWVRLGLVLGSLLGGQIGSSWVHGAS